MDAEKLPKGKSQAFMSLADKHGAHSVRVFGSVARGDSGLESDVDLLVKMEEGRSLLEKICST
jgi:predicted nucleotidyltransferase